VAGEFFIDTSAWYPILDPAHPHHRAVAAPLRALIAERRRVVTTSLVVSETHALMLRREGRRAARAGLDGIDRATDVLVHSTAALETAARRDWIDRFSDQAFSLADAVSFAVMRERRIEDVLTLDRHFAAAGFRVLPAIA
jgi:predicted nucleic acid-binding protein